MLIISYRSDTVLGILGTVFHFILIRALQAGIIIVILQMKKLRFWEVNSPKMWPVVDYGTSYPKINQDILRSSPTMERSTFYSHLTQ